jgi:hypothetical protein
MATAPVQGGSGAKSLNGFITAIESVLGDPYVLGAAGPGTFDCSGLVQWGLEKAGFRNVPRTSSEQAAWAQKITASQLQPGDLIFSEWPGDSGPTPGHVAIYVGGGQLIEAPETGEDVHKIALDANYKSHVTGYGRPPDSTGGTATGTLDSSNGSGGLFPTFWKAETGALGFLGGPLVSGFTGQATGVADVATTVGGIATDLGTIIHYLSFMFAPANWLRVGAFGAGGIILILGIYMLMHAK